MDDVSFRIANILVGNEPGVEAFEITHAGPKLIVNGGAR
jgi:allophanate hydrolase subunit 2